MPQANGSYAWVCISPYFNKLLLRHDKRYHYAVTYSNFCPSLDSNSLHACFNGIWYKQLNPWSEHRSAELVISVAVYLSCLTTCCFYKINCGLVVASWTRLLLCWNAISVHHQTGSMSEKLYTLSLHSSIHLDPQPILYTLPCETIHPKIAKKLPNCLRSYSFSSEASSKLAHRDFSTKEQHFRARWCTSCITISDLKSDN